MVMRWKLRELDLPRIAQLKGRPGNPLEAGGLVGPACTGACSVVDCTSGFQSGPGTSCNGIHWQLVRDANSGPHPRTTGSETLQVGPSNLGVCRFLVGPDAKFENLFQMALCYCALGEGRAHTG